MKKIFTRSLYLLVMVVLSGASLSTQGQDARFSQYFTTPYLTNPAFTALFQGDYQVMLNYRSQWGSVIENPFRTISAAGSAKIYPSWGGCDYIGLGLDILADQAGSLNFGTVQANISATYYKSLNGHGNHYLGLGFSTGMAHRQLQLDPNEDFLDEPEYLARENFNYLDAAAGLIWSYNPNQRNWAYAGASMFHLNRPEQSFFAQSQAIVGGQEELFHRYVLHAGGGVSLGDKLRLRPSVQIQFQGPAREIDFGSFIQFSPGHVTSKNENSIYLGAFYRWNDAAIVAARLDYDFYFITLSYDVNTSTLLGASQGRGALEISVAKALFRNQRPSCPNPVDCPVF